ncbi:DUF481 domain-containing protein [Mangrovimonas sp. YM274]|uniref:DUF481 domain-containing protein n=1 Tax=Mangrovimonas sp. YM274 TaxID=3070660 RepID=UPI0027DAEC07|nr:DUF481 domain-containing protein [Mangrovimonas sp. YM274]WMI67680.1 DUF481 domain-containing protein [Mangrovimonas sp. YM274]
MKQKVLCSFVVFIVAILQLNAQNDTIVLKNNNTLVGTMKEMNNGVLTIETDYSKDDFRIKWLHVKEVKSMQLFLINLSNGTRFNGSIKMSEDDPDEVLLVSETESITVKVDEIVYFKEVESDFISRVDAEVSVGFNFTKVNNLAQLAVNSKISYTGSKWFFNGGYNRVSSSQDNVESTIRTDATLGSRYFLKKDWFALASANFLSNDEQKLKLRTAVQGGIGKYIIHSNRMYLASGGGLAWNNERYTDPAISNRNSLEAFLAVEANLFDFDDFDLYTNVTGYPSLTEKNRFRTDLNITGKYDLPFNLFIKMGLTYNYDSKPVEGASTNDYVFQTTFGWETD